MTYQGVDNPSFRCIRITHPSFWLPTPRVFHQSCLFVFVYNSLRSMLFFLDLPRLCQPITLSPIPYSAIMQLLDSLPHTVRGVGREIVGHQHLSEPVNSHGRGNLKQRRERKRERLVDLVGFTIVVCSRFEPSNVVIN